MLRHSKHCFYSILSVEIDGSALKGEERKELPVMSDPVGWLIRKYYRLETRVWIWRIRRKIRKNKS